jgi:hypothetical protein
VRVVVYTKPGCGLCDELLADLAWAQRQVRFDVEPCDIMTDPELYERFRYLVPVLEIDGALHYPPHDALRVLNLLAEAAKIQS